MMDDLIYGWFSLELMDESIYLNMGIHRSWPMAHCSCYKFPCLDPGSCHPRQSAQEMKRFVSQLNNVGIIMDKEAIVV